MSIPKQALNDTALDVPFANVSLEACLASFEAMLHSEQGHNVFFINAHCLNTTFESADYWQTLHDADLVLPDGSGIAKSCKQQGNSLQANLNGTDLFPVLCQFLAEQQKSVYLLGASEEVNQAVQQWIRSNYPDLTIAGARNGYFTDAQEAEVVAAINDSGADMLLVGLGVPKQELWCQRWKSKLSTKINLAVGGLFDYYSGRIPRAPLWMRQRGIEWVWRLIQEPKRLFKRYVIGNPIFVYRIRQHHKIKHQVKQQFSLLDDKQIANMKRRTQLKVLAWRIDRWLHDAIKRATDIIGSICALSLLLPLLPLLAIVIKLDSPGPIFFGQIRAGVRGRPFRLWKLRTMCIDAEAQRAKLESQNEMQGGVTFKMKNDPRITRVGRVLRKYSLDELPQLWNVLLGDMALVGPRPALHSEIQQYTLAQRNRLDVKPGLTSDWVIAGRNSIPFERQAELDTDYVYHRSFWRDLNLLIKTLPALISGKGAS